MSVLTAPATPTHDLGGARFTSLATPSRGATDTSVWKVEILPGTPTTPHSLTREEVFVVLEGAASVRIAGNRSHAAASDAIMVPANANSSWPTPVPGRCDCCAVCRSAAKPVSPTADFTPPWAQ